MSSEAQPQEQDQHLRAQVELLRSEGQGQGQSGASSADGDYPSPPPGQANGNDQHSSAAAQDVQRAFHQQPRSENNDYIHPELRAAHGQQPPANMMPMTSSAPAPGPASHSNAVLQPNQQDLAPAASMAPGPSQEPVPQGGTSPPGNGRKQPVRELSQTKRAAQNRAAQRAFRHRKETYIKQLEDQNKNYINMEKAFKGLQSENYALKEYVITLQARLLDATGDFPPPPPNVNITPGNHQPQQTAEHEHGLAEPQHETQHQHAEQQPAKYNASPLEAVARAVADLAAEGEHQHTHQHQHQAETKEHEDVEMKQEPQPMAHTVDGQSQPAGSQA